MYKLKPVYDTNINLAKALPRAINYIISDDIFPVTYLGHH